VYRGELIQNLLYIDQSIIMDAEGSTKTQNKMLKQEKPYKY